MGSQQFQTDETRRVPEFSGISGGRDGPGSAKLLRAPAVWQTGTSPHLRWGCSRKAVCGQSPEGSLEAGDDQARPLQEDRTAGWPRVAGGPRVERGRSQLCSGPIGVRAISLSRYTGKEEGAPARTQAHMHAAERQTANVYSEPSVDPGAPAGLSELRVRTWCGSEAGRGDGSCSPCRVSRALAGQETG